MASETDIDRVALRIEVETQRRLIETLRRLNLQLRKKTLSGKFHPETNAPLDLRAEIESHTHLIESEYLDGLEERLRLTAELLEKETNCSNSNTSS